MPPFSSSKPAYTVRDLARDYEFPSASGAGQVVGVVLPGGGIDPADPTFATYFRALKIPPADAVKPRIEVVTVAGATNRPATYAQLRPFVVATGGRPGTPDPLGQDEQAPAGPAAFLPPRVESVVEHAKGMIKHLTARRGSMPSAPPAAASGDDIAWSGEGLMDVLLLLGLVPAAVIRVYVCPYSAQGFAAAVRRAGDDGVSALSMSFSFSEGKVPTEVDDALAYAAGKGVTLCAASGNGGSTEDGTTLSVGFPASSPWVLACGGTMPDGQGGVKAWNEAMGPKKMATGGGYSTRYARPAWQTDVGAGTWRGVPDVSSNASHGAGCWMWLQDPASPADAPTGYNWASLGTSSSAPVWAALVVRFNQILNRRLGHINPLLYRDAVRRGGFVDPSAGTNVINENVSQYSAGHGWDPCTGLGRPRGSDLLGVIRTALEMG
jgi:kumamolisin